MASQRQICRVQVPARTMSLKELTKLSLTQSPWSQNFHAAQNHSHYATCSGILAFPGSLPCLMGRCSQGYSGGLRVLLQQWQQSRSGRMLIPFNTSSLSGSAGFVFQRPFSAVGLGAWTVSAVIDCMKPRAEHCPNPLVHSCIHTE